MSSLLSEVEATGRKVRLVGQLLRKTAGISGLNAKALATIVKTRSNGASGPSMIYRVHAAFRPEKEAVRFQGQSLTFRQIDQRVDALAAALKTRFGLEKGNAAVIMMRNRPEMLEVQGAMNRVGGGAVSVSWRSTPKELAYLVNHSGAKAIFVEHEMAHVVDEARSEFTAMPEQNYFVVGDAKPRFVPYESALAVGDVEASADSDEGAVVIYTSGTTGKPKGAVRRFPKEAMEAILQSVLELPLRGDDRHLVVCPMYHSTALGFISFSMILGATVVIERDFEPERFLETVEREQITTTAMVPTMIHRVLSLPEKTLTKYDTRSLRAVISGGAPLSGTLARRFIERFGHILYNFYGATETGVNTLATSDELLRAPGTIGHVVPGNEIRLLDDEGREVARGKTGEVFVRNAMLVAGYHKDDEATRSSMRDGFFSVGDLAHQDEHGLFHIDGRKRDMIISGGVNVYPAEVEETLHRHPAVGEVAVVGMPDEEWGERVVAFVVRRAETDTECSESELIAYCKRELAGPKVPRQVRFIDELPKNPTGKILKRELRARVV